MDHRLSTTPNSLRATGWLIALLVLPLNGHARDVTVATLDDGPDGRALISLETLSDEISELMSDDFRVRLPAEKRVHADWTAAGARAALGRLLADDDVDVVITTGLLTSAAAASLEPLPKPVIALLVADIDLQGFPHDEGKSGQRNLVYLYDFGGIRAELKAFHDLARYRHVAVLADAQWVKVNPALGEYMARLAASLDAETTLVPVEAGAAEALARIPAAADAVYVTPLMRFDWPELSALAAGLVSRSLPSFSALGRAEVEHGLLGTTSGSTVDDVVLSRRVAILLRSILGRTDPGTLNVGFESHGRLVLNLRTARAIGFSPTWASRVDAEMLHRDEQRGGQQVSLIEAMEIAVAANLELRAVDLGVEIARDDIRLARSALLPQLGVDAVYQQIDDDRARFGIAPERSVDAQIVATQLLYSEPERADYDISRLLATAEDSAFRTALLDTLAAASSSYLAVLRSSALEQVTRSNVEVTRTNLDLAKMRERVGYSGRAEVLRWQSEIARDRQDLARAEAIREQSETELNRILNRPLADRLITSDQGLNELIRLIESPGFQRFVDNPMGWSVFQDYYTTMALRNSPEIERVSVEVRAQERQVTADRRTFYVPEVSLQARGGRSLDRSGTGAGAFEAALGDNDYSVGLQLSLPLFTSGRLRARLASSRNRLAQLRTEEEATQERVAARVRSALQGIGGSYPAIEFSLQSADAARSNLGLVTDQYQRGAITVTDLIDAQEAALQADLAAAETRYEFLTDFVEVQRAAGDFGLLLRPGSATEWIRDIESYFTEQGMPHQAR